MTHAWRAALRALRRAPGVALVAVVTLALGIGATTAVFSVVSALLLRPLTFAGGDAVVIVTEAPEGRPHQAGSTSYWNAADWNATSRTLEAVAVVDDWTPALTGAGRPERLRGATVTAEIFDVLRVRPALGRPILPFDGLPGSEPVVVVSDGFWRRRLAAEPSAVGRTVLLNDVSHRVVGVLPRGLRAPAELGGDVWGNHVPAPGDTRDGRSVRAWGRLAPGATLERVRAEMARISAGLERAHPAENAGMRAVVTPLRDEVAGDARAPLVLLLGAAAAVLLIACANLANLLLVRGLDRRREFAIRAALGGTRGGLARQVLAESGVLGLLGGAAGVVLASWATSALVAAGPAAVRGAGVPLDARVLGFAAGLSGLTVVLVGLPPAVRSARVDVVDGLRSGGRAAVGGSARARSVLVTAQVSLAVALLAGAGLLVESFARLQEVDPGIRADGVLTASLSLPAARYPDERIAPFLDDVLARLSRSPDVSAAGAVSVVPLSGDWDRVGVEVEGWTPPSGEDAMEADRYIVTPGYFAAMGVPLRAGRLLEPSDRSGGELVALVDEVFARRFSGGPSLVGRRLRFSWLPEPVRVVGVVGHVRHYGIDRRSGGQVYVPLAQVPWPWMSLVVRTRGEPEALVHDVRAAVESVDPDQPVFDVATMERRLGAGLATRRFTTLVLAGFAGVATLLAAVGLYGTIAYGVARRRGEMGLRMALGATSGRILASVMAGGLGVALRGLLLGLVLARAGARLLEGMLYGVGPGAPGVLAAVAALVLGTTLLASAVPAARAARVDPAETLRSE